MRKTFHKIHNADARTLDFLPDESVHLVITSPPYPMISMWDDIFSKMNNKIQDALVDNDGNTAFELMHVELYKTWKELFRIIVKGGIACINIGDATRTINKVFKLYPNHSKIIESFINIGFINLPEIIWRKPSNSPTKFLGSGMLPCGAFVTLEHEHILIFKKPIKRLFQTPSEKQDRYESSYFWEERNKWFSDLWELNGTRQLLNNKKVRERSAAFPFEIPYRLINMFSNKDDIVIDPFLGTGTTMIAAMASCRSSIGIELDSNFNEIVEEYVKDLKQFSNKIISDRLNSHRNAIENYNIDKSKHINKFYSFPVMTRQEVEIIFHTIEKIKTKKIDNSFEVNYAD
jgi:DNA modification methylase